MVNNMSRYLIALTVILLVFACNGTGHDDRTREVQAGPSQNGGHTFSAGEPFPHAGLTQDTEPAHPDLHAHSPGMAGHDDSANNVTYITEYGHIEFIVESIGTVGIFQGESGSLNGNIDFNSNTLEFTLNLRTLKTGIAMRDRDMYHTLNVEHYPTARFTGTFEPAYNPASFEKQPVTATGKFNMHGVTQDLVVEGTLLNQGSRVILEAGWIMNITDYDIIPPGLFKVKIGEELEVQLEAGLAPRFIASSP